MYFKKTVFVITVLLFCQITTAAEKSEGDAEEEVQLFPENPEQTDPALELDRLRHEGIAHYEAAIQLEKALEFFTRSYELSGDVIDAFNVSLVHFKQNNIDLTRLWLNKALELDPGFPNAHYLLGVVAREEGNYEEAQKRWETALKRAPDDGDLHYQLAVLARSSEDKHQFVQYLIQALAMEPTHTGALYQMYRYYQTSGNAELAKELLAKFTEIKRLEKFSRREKKLVASKLADPIRKSESNGFTYIDTPVIYRIQENEMGCAVRQIQKYSEYGEVPQQNILALCDNGEIVKFDVYKNQTVSLGRVPEDVVSISVESLDDQGMRVIANSKSKFFLSSPIDGSELNYQPVDSELPPLTRLADLDFDGDIDLIRGSGLPPLINTGELSFIEEPDVYETGPMVSLLEKAIDVATADISRSGTTDIVVLSQDNIKVLAGDTTGYQEARSVSLPEGATPNRVLIADYSNDGMLDVIVFGSGNPLVHWNLGTSATDNPLAFESLLDETIESYSAQSIDVNNDGLLDIASIDSQGAVDVLSNIGGGKFERNSIGEYQEPGGDLVAGDFNSDGKLDLVFPSQTGEIIPLINETDGGQSISLFLKGVRAAPSGVMTQVEVRRGSQYLYQQSPGGNLTLGIGENDYAEIVRYEWTNGFVENKLHVEAANTAYGFEESERISGSCPSIFTWNGDKYEYVTDAFISGPMGVPLVRGRYFPVTDNESILIRGEQIEPKNGRLSIRFTEELRETVYIDKAVLTAIDHPVDTEIAPHSRLAPVPPHEEAYSLAGRIVEIDTASGSNGMELTDTLKHIDGSYADFFSRGVHAGFAKEHYIEITVPADVNPSEIETILGTGWFYYLDSTSMIAEAQRTGGRLPWPELEQFIDDKWVHVGVLGVPAGKDKTAVMPVDGQLTSRRLRIVSGLSVYWDRISLGLIHTQSVANERVLSLDEATLRFRGYSELVSHNPETFDYHNVRFDALWNPMKGEYTKYGAVESLVSAKDGVYAVFGSGDEIALEFHAPETPPEPGLKRSYLLTFSGYVKDGDRYTAYANQVEPLPYLGMNTYPDDEAKARQEQAQESPVRNRKPFDYVLTTVGKNRVNTYD